MSSGGADELRFAIDANLDGFGHAVRLIGERMDQWNVTERARYIVDLALDEMLTNIVRYAYTDGHPPKEHAIDLVLRRSGDGLGRRRQDGRREIDQRPQPPRQRAREGPRQPRTAYGQAKSARPCQHAREQPAQQAFRKRPAIVLLDMRAADICEVHVIDLRRASRHAGIAR